LSIRGLGFLTLTANSFFNFRNLGRISDTFKPRLTYRLFADVKTHRHIIGLADHGLYGSTSCCISHGPSQWDRAIFDPPQLGDPSTDFHET